MSKLFLAPLIAGAILASNGLPSVYAQEAVQLHIDAIDTSAYPQLRATVTVIDSGGRPIPDLPAGAFNADVDGADVAVTAVATGLDPDVPAAVVLTFDSSGSMQGAPIDQARQAGKILVSELGANDQVAVMTFSNSVQVIQPFTNDRAALTTAIDGIEATGNTALYDAVVAAAGQTAPGGAQRRAIVLLSDGLDAGGVSKNDRATSLATARSIGVQFFVIGLGESVDQPYLQELAAVSRGGFYLAPSPEALQGLYETIGEALRSQYVVDLDAASLDPATARSLRIAVNAGGGSGAEQIALDLSAFAVVPAPTPVLQASPPVATTVATPIPTPAVQEGGGATSVFLPLGLAGGVLAVAVSAVVAFRLSRRRHRSDDERGVMREPEGLGPSAPVVSANTPVYVGSGPLGAPSEGDAWLEVATSDPTGRFALGEDPVTVGFTGDCTLCLPNGSSREAARVRVWRREGRFMLHNLSRLGRVMIAGKPAIWAVLEDGDEILLGSHRMVFHDSAEAAARGG